MTKYIKKPVLIDAVKWDGTNTDEVKRFGHGFVTEEKMSGGNFTLVACTLESNAEVLTRHAATVGDYLIRGVKGEYYFCKPDIFELTYDVVPE
jgi:hypothetical protein